MQNAAVAKTTPQHTVALVDYRSTCGIYL